MRRGKPKALVATERSILNAVWHMLANGECYQEAGADFFISKDPDKARRNAVKRLQELGFDVELTAREAA